ncbi:hypothetical protein GCM10010975_13880 [Comamonas phosphati]|nr:hypothetical protein GCM10010975_13880 [Comamonas phosphati]
MKTLVDQLAQYASYHRDPRNILTHYVGVPMIMFAVVVLLSRAQVVQVAYLADLTMAGIPVSLALLAALAATVYYCLLDWRYAMAMGLVQLAMLALAAPIAA